ncbi:MAG TPA: pseudouridine-5'-phosphate glycosidase [Gemmataceae bacterium]|nr:pseudouridine-5'-phosphate glycosidase [Gemmataceae bacterium]
MEPSSPLDVRPEVAAALREGRPVVVLGSGPMAHSLPWPINLEAAREAEAAVRREGAVPATIAVWQGKPTIGLGPAELEGLARGQSAFKAARRDLAAAIVQGRTAATTLGANLALARRAGIRLVVTGGVGSLGRAGEHVLDIPDDLVELSRGPVAVVCAGAKGVVGLPRTTEILESFGVPVVGYGTDSFPAFYVRQTSYSVSTRVNNPGEAAKLLATHWALDGAGVLLAQPAPAEAALDPELYGQSLLEIEGEAAKVRSKDLTPFLTSRLARLTGNRTLSAYKTILASNAALAARIARHLSGVGTAEPAPQPSAAR